MLASLEDGVVVLDLAACVVDVNPAAEQLTGVSAAQAKGQDVTTLFGVRRENAWIGELAHATLAQGVPRRAVEGTLARRGDEVPVSAACAPVQDPHGGHSGAVVVIRDLTLQRTLEAAAARADRLAALAPLAEGLAHEIRNPLGGIKGAAQLLRGTLHDPEQVRCTEIIVREVERLDELLEQLRDLARRRVPVIRAVNIHRVVNDVLDLQRRTPEWGRVRLRTEFDPSLPPVEGDPAQLAQVVLNLVRNALQAMGGEGDLLVSTRIEHRFHVRRGRTRAQMLALLVEDTGPGISADDEANLFSPFFTTKPRGTGLGLAICQRIVAEHGGTITYEPGRPRGARFRVTLPTSDHDVD